ncbi:MAG: hypothetical protein ACREHF_02275 [Rhizomicrobium sp.]
MRRWPRSDQREFTKLFVRFSEARQAGSGAEQDGEFDALRATAAAARVSLRHAASRRSKGTGERDRKS